MPDPESAHGEGSVPDPPPAIALAQYAAVKAALAEPFPLDEVLAVEGIDAATWAEADLAWKVRLVDDAATLARFQVALARAEDRLGRRVDPVELDLEAWVAFLERFAAADAGDALASLGLGVNDLSRLRRHWQRRMKLDPELEPRVPRIKKRGVRPLPPLRVEPPRLRPSGVKPAPAPVAVEAARAEPAVPELSVDRYAALCAELDLAPEAGPAVLARYGVPAAARAALDRSFQDRFSRDPAEAKDFVLLRGHHRARLRAFQDAPDPPERRDPGSTQKVRAAALRAPPLPFRATPTPGFLDALAKTPAAPGDGSDGQTVAIRRSPAKAPAPPDLVARDDETTTVLAAPSRAVEPAAEDDETTTVRPRPVIADEPTQPWEDLLFETVTNMRLSVPDPVPGPPAASLPPPLSLERHASLCVEIALSGAGMDDALARYQMTAAQKEQADQYWKARVAADPAVRAAWNQAFLVYRAWFTGQAPG